MANNTPTTPEPRALGDNGQPANKFAYFRTIDGKEEEISYVTDEQYENWVKEGHPLKNISRRPFPTK